MKTGSYNYTLQPSLRQYLQETLVPSVVQKMRRNE